MNLADEHNGYKSIQPDLPLFFDLDILRFKGNRHRLGSDSEVQYQIGFGNFFKVVRILPTRFPSAGSPAVRFNRKNVVSVHQCSLVVRFGCDHSHSVYSVYSVVFENGAQIIRTTEETEHTEFCCDLADAPA